MNAQETTIAVLAAQLAAANKRADDAKEEVEQAEHHCDVMKERIAWQGEEISKQAAEIACKSTAISTLRERAETAEKLRDRVVSEMNAAASSMGLDVATNAQSLNGNLIMACASANKETNRLNKIFAQSGSLFNLVNDAADALATLRGITGQDDSVCIQEVVKAIQAMCGPKPMTAANDLKAGEPLYLTPRGTVTNVAKGDIVRIGTGAEVPPELSGKWGVVEDTNFRMGRETANVVLDGETDSRFFHVENLEKGLEPKQDHPRIVTPIADPETRRLAQQAFDAPAASKRPQHPAPSTMDDDEHRGEAWERFKYHQGHAPVHDVSFDAGWKAGRACPWPLEK